MSSDYHLVTKGGVDGSPSILHVGWADAVMFFAESRNIDI